MYKKRAWSENPQTKMLIWKGPVEGDVKQHLCYETDRQSDIWKLFFARINRGNGNKSAHINTWAHGRTREFSKIGNILSQIQKVKIVNNINNYWFKIDLNLIRTLFTIKLESNVCKHGQKNTRYTAIPNVYKRLSFFLSFFLFTFKRKR